MRDTYGMYNSSEVIINMYRRMVLQCGIYVFDHINSIAFDIYTACIIGQMLSLISIDEIVKEIDGIEVKIVVPIHDSTLVPITNDINLNIHEIP